MHVSTVGIVSFFGGKRKGTSPRFKSAIQLRDYVVDMLDSDRQAYQLRQRAALERRKALFEDVVRRIHETGVDVAELLEREEVRAVLGVVEVVRRRPVYRHGPCKRVRLGFSCPAWTASVSM